MGMIWSLSVLVALVVFIAALSQGRNFGVALRMGVGVLILGIAAILALTLLGVALRIFFTVFWLALFVAVVYGLIVIAGRAIKGNL